MQKNLKHIVLTGGPCAGKTTALARLTDLFQNLGFRVLVVPEMATLLFQGGVQFPFQNPIEFQKMLMKATIGLEDSFRGLGMTQPEEKIIVISDRGLIDSKAYVGPKWPALLESLSLSEDQLMGRYDAVFHLVSAANGAEAYYSTANNAARRETAEEARALDQLTMEAWVGHTHLRVVGNGPDGFEGKMQRLKEAVSRAVGLPDPLEVERKFLVQAFDLTGVKHTVVDIEQMYLSDGSRIRRRDQSYFHTKKFKRPDGPGAIELESRISDRTYSDMRSLKSPSQGVLRKRRHLFVYEEQYFELDVFENPELGGLVMMELEIDNDAHVVKIPPFIKVIREVTEENEFKNKNLARKIR